MPKVDYIVDAVYNIIKQAQELAPDMNSIQPMSSMKIIKFGDALETGFKEHSVIVGCTGWSAQGMGGIGSSSVQHYENEFGIHIPKTYQITLLISSSSPTIVTAIAEYLFDVLIAIKSRVSKALAINTVVPAAVRQDDNIWTIPLNLFVTSSVKLETDHIAKVVSNITLESIDVV